MTGKTKKAKLEGRVASILNAHELVINIGSDAGVESGQTFAVLAATPVEVADPDSGKILDKIDREKIRVEAHEVRAKITICRTYRMRGGVDPIISSVLASTMFGRSRPETLRADDSDKPPPLEERDSYVKIKDRVVAVDDA